MSVPPPPPNSTYVGNSSPRRYLRSRTRTASIDLRQQSSEASPAHSPLVAQPEARYVPPVVGEASPSFLPVETSPTKPLIPSYGSNSIPYTSAYTSGSEASVSFPSTSPLTSAATTYTPTSPLTSELPSSHSIGRSSSNVRRVSYGLPPRVGDQGSPIQIGYVPREENPYEYLLQGGPYEPQQATPTHYRTLSTSSISSHIGAHRDADAYASGPPLSPPSLASPGRRPASFHLPALPSTSPAPGAGGVLRFAVGFPPRPQSQPERPSASVSTSFRSVTSSTTAVDLHGVSSQNDIPPPPKPYDSHNDTRRFSLVDSNTVMPTQFSLASAGAGPKTQSPGTVLFQTPHPLADTFLPRAQFPLQDEPIGKAEREETPALNDSPSSMSLTVPPTPVVSPSVARGKIESAFPVNTVPDTSRTNHTEIDTATATEGPDDTSEDIISGHVPISLMPMNQPVPSERPVEPVTNDTITLRKDWAIAHLLDHYPADHDKGPPEDYRPLPPRPYDITTRIVASSPLPSSSPLSMFASAEGKVIDDKTHDGPSQIVEPALPNALPPMIVAQKNLGSSPASFISSETSHKVEISTVSDAHVTDVVKAAPSAQVEKHSIFTAGLPYPKVDAHHIGSDQLVLIAPPSIKPLQANASEGTPIKPTKHIVHTVSNKLVPKIPTPSVAQVIEVVKAALPSARVEESSIPTPRLSPEVDLYHAASEGLAFEIPTASVSHVTDVLETAPPSAHVEGANIVTSGPNPEADLHHGASGGLIPEISTASPRVPGTVKSVLPTAYVQEASIVTSRPSPGAGLYHTASDGFVLEIPTTALDLHPRVTDMVEAATPSVHIEGDSIATSRANPGVDLYRAASDGLILGVSTALDLDPHITDVVEAVTPSVHVEVGNTVTAAPKPEVDLYHAASDGLIHETSTALHLDPRITDVIEDVPPSVHVKEDSIVRSEPGPEVDPYHAASDELVHEASTTLDGDIIATSGPNQEVDPYHTASDELVPDISSALDLGPRIADVVEAVPTGVHVEEDSILTSRPRSEVALDHVASDELVHETSIVRDLAPRITDIVEAVPPSAHVNEDSVVMSGPDPETVTNIGAAAEHPEYVPRFAPDLKSDVYDAVPHDPVPEFLTTSDSHVSDVVETMPPTAHIEDDGIITSELPSVGLDLYHAASDAPVGEFPAASDPHVIDVVEAVLPSTPIEEASIVRSGFDPEVDPYHDASDGLVHETSTALDLDSRVTDVVEAVPLSAHVEKASGVTSEPDPKDHLYRAASDELVPEISTSPDLDSRITDVVEAVPPSASVTEDSAVMSGPDPEIHLYHAVSDGVVLGLSTALVHGPHDIDVIEAVPPSVQVKDNVVTSGPDPETIATQGTTAEDPEPALRSHVIDVAEAVLPNADAEELGIITPGSPNPEVDLYHTAPDGPALEVSTALGPDPTTADVGESVPHSIDIKEDSIVMSGPDPEVDLYHTAPDGLILGVSNALDLEPHVTDVTYAVPPSVHVKEDTSGPDTETIANKGATVEELEHIVHDTGPDELVPEFLPALDPHATDEVEAILPSAHIEEDGIIMSGSPNAEIDLHHAVPDRLAPEHSTPSDPHLIDVPVLPSARVEDNLVTLSPNLDVDLWDTASDGLVFERSPISVPHVIDIVDAGLPSAYMEEASVVTPGPDPEADLYHAASDELVHETSTASDLGPHITDVVEALPPSIHVKEDRIAMPGPDQDVPLHHAASDSLILGISTALDLGPRVPHVASAALPRVHLQEHNIVPSGPKPEVYAASDELVHETSTALDLDPRITYVVEAVPPSIRVNEDSVVTSGPDPEVDLHYTASSSLIPVVSPTQDLDPRIAEGVEAVLPSLHVQEDSIVPSGPRPEAHAASDELVHETSTAPDLDVHIADVVEAVPPSVHVNEDSIDTSGLNLEVDLYHTASDELDPDISTTVDPDRRITDVVEDVPLSIHVKEDSIVTSGPDPEIVTNKGKAVEDPEHVARLAPDLEINMYHNVPDEPVPEFVTTSDSHISDVVEPIPLTAHVEDEGIIMSGSPSVGLDLYHAASDAPVGEFPTASDPHVIDVVEAVLPNTPIVDPYHDVSDGFVHETSTALDLDPRVTDVVEAVPPSSHVEKGSVVTSEPDPTDHLYRAASDELVPEISTAPDPRIADVFEALPPSVHVNEDNIVTSGLNQEVDLDHTASDELDPEISTTLDSYRRITDVAKVVLPGVYVEVDSVVASGPDPEPISNQVASVEDPEYIAQIAPDLEIDGRDTAPDELVPEPITVSNPHVLDVIEAVLPSAHAEEESIVTSRSTYPEADPYHVAQDALVPDISTASDPHISNVIKAVPPSGHAEEDSIDTSGPSPDDDLYHAVPDGFTPDISTASDLQVLDVIEVVLPSVHVEEGSVVRSGAIPEDDLYAPSDEFIHEPSTVLDPDPRIADIIEAVPPSIRVEEDSIVTSGLDPEVGLYHTGSDGYSLNTETLQTIANQGTAVEHPDDIAQFAPEPETNVYDTAPDDLVPEFLTASDPHVTDVAEATLPKVPISEDSIFTSGSPNPEIDLYHVAPDEPIPDVPTALDPHILDVVEAVLPSVRVEEESVVTSGPIPENNLYHAAPDELVPEISIASDLLVLDVIDAVPPSVYVKEDSVVVSGPDPEADAYHVAPVELVPDISIAPDLDHRITNAVETVPPSEPVKEDSIVTSGPDPEVDLYHPASDEVPLRSTALDLDPHITYAVEAVPPSIPVKEDIIVEYGPNPETINQGIVIGHPERNARFPPDLEINADDTVPDELVPEPPTPLDSHVIDAVEAVPPSVRVEEDNIITFRSPYPEVDPYHVAPNGIVHDVPTASDPHVLDAVEAVLPVVHVEEDSIVISGPIPEDNLYHAALDRLVPEASIPSDSLVLDVVDVVPPGVQVKDSIVTSGPDPKVDLRHTAPGERIPDIPTALDLDPRNTDVIEAVSPSVHVKEDNVITSGSNPEAIANQETAVEQPEHTAQFAPDLNINVFDIAPDEPVPESSTPSDSHVTDMVEAIPPSVHVEDSIGTSEPIPEDDLYHAAPDGLIPEVSIPSDLLSVVEAVPPSVHIKGDSVIMSGLSPEVVLYPTTTEGHTLSAKTVQTIANQGAAVEEPEHTARFAPDLNITVYDIAPDEPVPESSTASDSHATDVVEAMLPSVHVEEDSTVTSRSPYPQVDLYHVAPDRLVPYVSTASDSHVADMVEAIPPRADVEKDDIITSGSPNAGVDLYHAASDGLVSERSTPSDPHVLDLVEVVLPSVHVEEDRIVTSGPSPDDDLYHAAPDGLTPEISTTLYPHVTDVVDTVLPNAHAGEGAVTSGPDSEVDLYYTQSDRLVPIAPLDTLQTTVHQGTTVEQAEHTVHFIPGVEINEYHSASDVLVPIALLDTETLRSTANQGGIIRSLVYVSHFTSDSEIRLPNTASIGFTPIALLDSKTPQTSANQETSVQQAEPSERNTYLEADPVADAKEPLVEPVGVGLDAVESPGHRDIPAHTVPEFKAAGSSTVVDVIEAQTIAPPSQALYRSTSLTVTPEAPTRHVGFASPMVTVLQVDDTSETAAKGSEWAEPYRESDAVGNGIRWNREVAMGQWHVPTQLTAEAISPVLHQISQVGFSLVSSNMANSISPSTSVSQESLGASEVSMQSPGMSRTPTNSELALHADGSEPSKLDKQLASPRFDSTSYPSLPLSNIDLISSRGNGDQAEAHDEIAQLHTLPRELAIDADTLVRSPRTVPPTPREPLPSRSTDVHWSRPPPVHAPDPPGRMRAYLFVFRLLFYFFPQIDLASKVQTVPQSTGFFNILGGFLIDMTFELSYLFWFFLSVILFPRILFLLWYIVMHIIYIFFGIVSLVLGKSGRTLRNKIITKSRDGASVVRGKAPQARNG